MGNADLIRELTEKWNAGDVDSVADLYTEDAEIRTGPHWPEVTTYRGREAIRETSAEWASMWETLQIQVDTLEEYGERRNRSALRGCAAVCREVRRGVMSSPCPAHGSSLDICGPSRKVALSTGRGLFPAWWLRCFGMAGATRRRTRR